MLLELSTNELGRVRAIISVTHPHDMLVELSINPVELDSTDSLDLIARLRICTEAFLCSAGPEIQLDQVIDLIKTIHEVARSSSTCVLTTMRIEDRRIGSAEAQLAMAGPMRQRRLALAAGH
jgi:hypothetical protein